jgi:two-component sensor histidine kinase/CheY-like chemotaxis protein
MEEELKILMLEDVQYDAELVKYELRREGIKFLSVRVETEIDFVRELENFKPDIILVDHSLPNFDGISALEIAQKRSPETPFIFVSGKIGGEFAVEMLKKGATDYVFKNNLTKLAPAVKRALTERNELAELKKSKKQLQKALKEKEMLLKEIHHRVKNNLMIISSLLELQSHYINDEKDFDFFRENKNRAYSMALIHERLYRSNNLKMIDFEDYIRKLAVDLFGVYAIDPDQIKLIFDVEDIMLDVNTAIPLGLIINELLTNSLKYAFPMNVNRGPANEKFANPKTVGREPENEKLSSLVTKDHGNTDGALESPSGINNITINLIKNDDEFTLMVKDNGIGFPEGMDFKNTNSMGLELVNSLTKQIGGIIELDNVDGTEFKITFKELDYNGSI